MKSSSEISDIQKDDIALQYYVLKESYLISISSVSLIHINKQYIREGKIEVSELFTTVDMTEFVIQEQEEIQNKIESYLGAHRESRPPKRWHEIYTLITKSKTKEELEEDLKNKSAGLQLIQGNENFAGMVPQYKAQIMVLKDKAGAFESAEMMLPHMARFAKDKLRSVNLKKIKALSKKLAKKDKGKKK